MWENVETAAHAKVTWHKFNFSSCSNAKLIFRCLSAPPLLCCLPSTVCFFFSLYCFFFPLLMLFSRLSLTGLPPAPSAMLPQAPQHLPVPQHSSCKFFFFLVVLHLLTLVSKRYLQLLLCPIPLCHVPTLRQHHPLHTSSTPLLASFGCINASVTTPVCPQLNVSFFFLSFCFCSLLLCCPFVPHPFPYAMSVLSCHIPSLMPHPFPYATSPPSCCILSLMLHPFSHTMSPPSCCVCSLMPCPFSCATSSPPPVLHQPPFPWPIPATSTSWPLCAVLDAPVLVDTSPLHAILCMRRAPTPSYALALPYACVCACSCVIVHLLLYMY